MSQVYHTKLEKDRNVSILVTGRLKVDSAIVNQEKDVDIIIEDFRTYCDGLKGAVYVDFDVIDGRQDGVFISNTANEMQFSKTVFD